MKFKSHWVSSSMPPAYLDRANRLEGHLRRLVPVQDHMVDHVDFRFAAQASGWSSRARTELLVLSCARQRERRLQRPPGGQGGLGCTVECAVHATKNYAVYVVGCMLRRRWLQLRANVGGAAIRSAQSSNEKNSSECSDVSLYTCAQTQTIAVFSIGRAQRTRSLVGPAALQLGGKQRLTGGPSWPMRRASRSATTRRPCAPAPESALSPRAPAACTCAQPADSAV